MFRKDPSFLELGIEEEVDPKDELNSLISVTISTVMCIAAKCALPKSNVEATRHFLRTIVDENGENPRNIKAFLLLLNEYKGPYEEDNDEKKSPTEELTIESYPKLTEGIVAISKPPESQALVLKEPSAEGITLTKRTSITKKEEKEQTGKKTPKNSVRISASKSTISNKTIGSKLSFC